MTSKKRKVTPASAASKRPAPRAPLKATRVELRSAVARLKALGCEDSMILVEFWDALDRVNGTA